MVLPVPAQEELPASEDAPVHEELPVLEEALANVGVPVHEELSVPMVVPMHAEPSMLVESVMLDESAALEEVPGHEESVELDEVSMLVGVSVSDEVPVSEMVVVVVSADAPEASEELSDAPPSVERSPIRSRAMKSRFWLSP